MVIMKSTPQELRRERYRRVSVITAAIGGAAAAAVLTSHHLDKELMHTSRLTGQDWIEELLEGTQSCINYARKCLENVLQATRSDSASRWEWRSLFSGDCCMTLGGGVDFRLQDMCLQKSNWQYFFELRGQD